ncbi:hypothetical protein Tco_0122210 [Tanacetum coccineum]
MDNSKRGYIPMQEKLDLNKTQGASTPEEVKRMQNVPYASALGSIMYADKWRKIVVAKRENKGETGYNCLRLVTLESGLNGGNSCCEKEKTMEKLEEAEQTAIERATAQFRPQALANTTTRQSSLSALENMHYSQMIRFDNAEEARKLQSKIDKLKQSSRSFTSLLNIYDLDCGGWWVDLGIASSIGLAIEHVSLLAEILGLSLYVNGCKHVSLLAEVWFHLVYVNGSKCPGCIFTLTAISKWECSSYGRALALHARGTGSSSKTSIIRLQVDQVKTTTSYNVEKEEIDGFQDTYEHVGRQVMMKDLKILEKKSKDKGSRTKITKHEGTKSNTTKFKSKTKTIGA